MPTQQEIDAFCEGVRKRDRERMKIIGFTLTVKPINEDVIKQQHKLPEVPDGQS